MFRQNLILIFLLATCLFSTGQTTSSIVDTNRLWSVKYTSCESPFPPFDNYFCKFSDSTIIDSIQYKTVLGTQDTTLSSWTVYGYIREDSLKKVYFRNTSGVEGLIYDFGVNSGDTIIIKNTNINNDTTLIMVVYQIDSIFIYNKFLKQIHLYRDTISSYYDEIWIESIGSKNGILHSCYNNYYLIGICYELLCYSENDTLKYMNPNYNSCYFTTDIKDSYFSKTKISLYPNPVNSTSVFHIENPVNDFFYLEIYNTLGEKINILTFNKDGNAYINKSDFSNGLYFYTLVSNNFRLTNGKFEIER